MSSIIIVNHCYNSADIIEDVGGVAALTTSLSKNEASFNRPLVQSRILKTLMVLSQRVGSCRAIERTENGLASLISLLEAPGNFLLGSLNIHHIIFII
jgi:hypothetical protein